jgi:hypothetical protein
MAVRTSAVVVAGMILLSAAGVAAVFGESIVAVLAPPEAPAVPAPAATAAAPGSEAPRPPATAPAQDGGAPGGG